MIMATENIILFWHIEMKLISWPLARQLKVHLAPNTISTKKQTWSCSKSDFTFFPNMWIFFEQQYNLKFDTLCLMTELVRGMGLFPIWCHKLFCMHVHKELMPCKWVCDVKSGIEPGPATFCWFLKLLKIPDTDKIIKFFSWMFHSFILAEKKFGG